MHSAGTDAPDFQATLQEASDVEQCPTAGAKSWCNRTIQMILLFFVFFFGK
jgi:hypothetical protein